MRRLLLGARLFILTLILSLTALLIGPARAAVIGPGTPPDHGFSGYVARNGAALGVARLPDGTWGICLDTGKAWRWPTTTPHSRLQTDPTIGYLTSVCLTPARRDAALAAALWWAVGERLNSHPRAVREHLRRMRRESPRIGRRVAALHQSLLSDAKRNAPPAGGYQMAAPALSRTDLSGIGVRSGTGAWVPGLATTITLTGGTFSDGHTSWTGVTSTAGLSLSVQPTGPVTITATVAVSGLPSPQFRIFTPQHAHRQRVATAAAPASLHTVASVAFVPARPRVSTAVNLQRANAGATVTDRVVVSGTSGERGAPPVVLEWQLLGPVRADASSTCRGARWSGAPLLTAGRLSLSGDSTVTVGATRAARGGCYGYRERLLPTAYSLGTGWTTLGIVPETSLVSPPVPRLPRHPAVASGGESNGTDGARDRIARTRVTAPALGLDATISRVDFRGATLTPPHAISTAGLWRRGAALDDVAGTTVLVGHVSDNHDRPGAFHRLLRARVGQNITTTIGSRTTTWRISAISRVDRDRLSRDPFLQRVARRLVLITCANRVTTARGGFHYAKNLIVEAVPR
ncbi:class F sortase [Nocardioides sp.]|uniref:class F sortase n=1 Tax=Nocardioides sp. TaxID=35761 RepID=UPI0026297E07|nr:class F sortase [Nocardioides sp.]